ncbi:MAG TPA: hypothetical protein PKW55_07930 [Spirochaetota bacterium]|nr:hypothetical protein [Spirochaetota bacterium]HOM38830.1 hypothetical protein [Spirochaetota bacterium]HPQ49888.1 hypothetical protein [Spirochaetota bacterium]
MPKVYKENDILFDSTGELEGIYYILDGEVMISTKFDFEGITYELFLSPVSNNTFVGVENIFSQISNYYIKVSKDSFININEIKEKSALINIINEKPEFGIQILRSMLKNTAKMADSIVQLNKISMNMHKLNVIGLGTIGYIEKEIINKVSFTKAADAYNFFKDNNISVYPISENVFKAPFHKFVDEDFFILTDVINKNDVTFFTKLYMLPTTLQNNLYNSDPFFISYFLEKVCLYFKDILSTTQSSFDSIIANYQQLVGENGILQYLKDILKYIKTDSDKENIKKLIRVLANNFKKVLSPLEEFSLVFHKKIIDVLDKRIKEEEKTVVEKEEIKVEESYTIPDELKDSMQKIIEYSEISQEDYQLLIKRYEKFKRLESKLSGDDEAKKLRDSISNIYWKIYESSFIKFYQSNKIIKPVELMFRFGLFDETLISKKTLVDIYNYKPEPVSEELPVYDMFEWLQKIIFKEIEPSISTMGDDYQKSLNEEAKRKSVKTVVTPEEIDNVNKRINFEISNLVSNAAKVCSGEIFNYSPILMEEAFPGSSYNFMTTKDKIIKEFMAVKNIDFSIFYREVSYRDKDKDMETFVKKEILPNIVLLPTWGKRGMVWQVKERPRTSRGRIVLPHFFTENNLNDIIIEIFGIYRWEILKELLGPLWNDLTQLSLTAEYMDYLHSYRKSKDIPLELKEKIKEEFKKFRSDRDKFVNDYLKWIKYDSQGRPSVNVLVRNIFYRQIPFKKEIRDKIKDMPAYADFHNRFVNLRKKDLINLRNKYHKYTKDGQTLPKELQDTINFYMR